MQKRRVHRPLRERADKEFFEGPAVPCRKFKEDQKAVRRGCSRTQEIVMNDAALEQMC